MSIYIVLANYTQQGITNIKESPDRVNAARELARTCGAEMKDFKMTLGAYDMLATVEAPNDQAVAKFVIALGSLGNVRTTTLKAFTEQEYREIIQALP